MKKFNKNISFTGLSKKACPFHFFCNPGSSLHKVLIIVVTLILLSWFVRANKLSAWTAKLYVEDKGIEVTSIMIGVASEAHQKDWEHPPDPNSVILVLYTLDANPLSEDIRRRAVETGRESIGRGR